MQDQNLDRSINIISSSSSSLPNHNYSNGHDSDNRYRSNSSSLSKYKNDPIYFIEKQYHSNQNQEVNNHINITIQPQVMTEEQLKAKEQLQRKIRQREKKKMEQQKRQKQEQERKSQFPLSDGMSKEQIQQIKEEYRNNFKHPSVRRTDRPNQANEKNKRCSQIRKMFKQLLFYLHELSFQKQLTSKEQKIKSLSRDLQIKQFFRICQYFQGQLYRRFQQYKGHKFQFTDYKCLLQLVIQQFHDKDNFEFRRRVVNQEHDMKKVCRATKFELMCEKTRKKKQQQQRLNYKTLQKVIDVKKLSAEDTLQYFERLNNPNKQNKPEIIQEQEPMPSLSNLPSLSHLPSVNSIKSANSIQEAIIDIEPTPQQKRQNLLRMKQRHKKKLKQTLRRMNQRMNKQQQAISRINNIPGYLELIEQIKKKQTIQIES